MPQKKPPRAFCNCSLLHIVRCAYSGFFSVWRQNLKTQTTVGHRLEPHMSDLTPEDIFRIHPKIRWAALSTEGGLVKFCQMRPAVVSHTSDEVDRSFMELGPAIITGISERLSPDNAAGKVESVIVNFEKDSVLITRIKDEFLAISVDHVDALHTFQEVAESLRSL
jgi:hypothetical protein